MRRYFTSINEPIADFKWQKMFRERWPAYKRWLNTGRHFSDAATAVAALGRYMPEMLPTHDHLCRLVNADELAVAFLTGFQPPAYNSACSQAVSTVNSVQLVRNYDYHVARFEGTQLMTAWHGKRVIANSDSLAGVLDGMNEDGLVVSLTFGGRSIVGFGFGLPFILRYVLEFCSNVAEGIEVLRRVPSHMAYNVTLTDKSGLVRTVELAPDRTALVSHSAFATNHQGAIEWAENGDFNNTAGRATYIEKILKLGYSGEKLTNAFLQAPLYNTRFSEGLGTLYTAVYKPIEGSVELRWPKKQMLQTFDHFTEKYKLISYKTKYQKLDTDQL